MRLNNYLQNNEYPCISTIMAIMESSHINEMAVPDTVFNYLKTMGNKMGFNIKRSDTIFGYIGRMEENMVDLFTYATLYFFSKDDTQKKELYGDMKEIIKRVDAREIASFMLRLDKATLGVSSHVKFVLMNLFGIEISTYNKVVSEIEWITKEIGKIKQALHKMNAKPEVFKSLENFEFALSNVSEDGEGAVTTGATLTGNIDKFEKRLTGVARRLQKKKKKDMRKLI